MSQVLPFSALKRPADILPPAAEQGDLAEMIAACASGRHLAAGEWVAPRERMVLFLENFRIGSRLAEALHRRPYEISFDAAGARVAETCGADELATWEAAFTAGYAHSVEVWSECGALIGGCYGIAIGRVFFLEASFSAAPDAGKIAVAMLHKHLQRAGYLAIVAKELTGATLRLGFTSVSQPILVSFLEKACLGPNVLGTWRYSGTGTAAERPGLRRGIAGSA